MHVYVNSVKDRRNPEKVMMLKPKNNAVSNTKKLVVHMQKLVKMNSSL